MPNVRNDFVQYIYGRGNKKLGVIVSFVQDTNVYVGFSLCNRKVEDFIKKFGKNIARSRAERWAGRQECVVIGPGKIFKSQKNFHDHINKQRDWALTAKVEFPEVDVVKIPQTVSNVLKKHIELCRQIFEHHIFPEWVIKFEETN